MIDRKRRLERSTFDAAKRCSLSLRLSRLCGVLHRLTVGSPQRRPWDGWSAGQPPRARRKTRARRSLLVGLLSVCLVVSADDSASVTTGQPRVVTNEDRQFWSFRPLAEITPPQVANDDGWVRNPIDQFIRAAHHAKTITPAPALEKRKWIRHKSEGRYPIRWFVL